MIIRFPFKLAFLYIGIAIAFPMIVQAQEKFPKTITYVVGTGAGGGFDEYGRLAVRYMSKYLPGTPTIVVQNMPGAGGIKSLSWLATAAPRDGSAVASMPAGAVFAPIQGLPGATYDATKFNYLISLDSLANMLIVWHTTPFMNAKDAFEKEIILGNSSGPTQIIPAMFNRLIGTKFKIITGYKGTNEVGLAMERGEVQGSFNWAWTSIVAKPQMLQEKLIRILMQLTFNPINDPRLKNVPSLNDFVKEGVEKDILEILLAQQELGRSIIAPQDVPAGVVKTYRSALMKVANDPNYRADAKKGAMTLNITPGEKVEAYVKRIYSVPKSTIEQMNNEIELAKKEIHKR